MFVITYNSEFGKLHSKIIDWKTTDLGWNLRTHWEYLKNPTGVSHTEVEMGKEAAIWYVEWLWGNEPEKMYELYELSYRQIQSSYKAKPVGPINLLQVLEYGPEFNQLVIHFIQTGLISLCFSAREENKKASWKLIYINPEEKKWNRYPLESTLEIEKKTIRWIDENLDGLPYGYKTAAGFLTKWNIITKSKKEPICSGSTADILDTKWCHIRPRKGYPAAHPNQIDRIMRECPENMLICQDCKNAEFLDGYDVLGLDTDNEPEGKLICNACDKAVWTEYTESTYLPLRTPLQEQLKWIE